MLTITGPILSQRSAQAMAAYAMALGFLVRTLEEERWDHDDAHVGLHAAALEQARADRDAAMDAIREARKNGGKR